MHRFPRDKKTRFSRYCETFPNAEYDGYKMTSPTVGFGQRFRNKSPKAMPGQKMKSSPLVKSNFIKDYEKLSRSMKGKCCQARSPECPGSKSQPNRTKPSKFICKCSDDSLESNIKFLNDRLSKKHILSEPNERPNYRKSTVEWSRYCHADDGKSECHENCCCGDLDDSSSGWEASDEGENTSSIMKNDINFHEFDYNGDKQRLKRIIDEANEKQRSSSFFRKTFNNNNTKNRCPASKGYKSSTKRSLFDDSKYNQSEYIDCRKLSSTCPARDKKNTTVDRTEKEQEWIKQLGNFCDRVKENNKPINFVPSQSKSAMSFCRLKKHKEESSNEDEFLNSEFDKKHETIVRIMKPKESEKKTNLKKIFVYPPLGERGPPLTLYKNSSNINCSVTGNKNTGCRYEVTYVQKYISPKWSTQDKKFNSTGRSKSSHVPETSIPSYKHGCCCSNDYG